MGASTDGWRCRWVEASGEEDLHPASSKSEGGLKDAILRCSVFHVLIQMRMRQQTFWPLFGFRSVRLVYSQQQMCQKGRREARHTSGQSRAPTFSLSHSLCLSFSTSYRPVLLGTLNGLVKDKRPVQRAEALSNTELYRWVDNVPLTQPSTPLG